MIQLYCKISLILTVFSWIKANFMANESWLNRGSQQHENLIIILIRIGSHTTRFYLTYLSIEIPNSVMEMFMLYEGSVRCYLCKPITYNR